MMRVVRILLTLAMLGVPALAVAQVATVQIPIEFGTGALATELSDTVTGDEVLDYLIVVADGQSLGVTLKADYPVPYFNILKTGADEAIFIGSRDGDSYTGSLADGGSYTIRVYQMGAAEDEGTVTPFTLKVALERASVAAETADFADGNAGGPDFWTVTGVGRSGLNVRSAPNGDIILRLSEGAVVRNRGCQTAVNGRWCEIGGTGDADFAGWVFGRYLQEAAMPSGTGDALVEGTNFNATGAVSCVLQADPSTNSCPFGVTRGSSGVATVFITLPNGFVRVLEFRGGGVAPMSAVQAFESSRSNDETVVIVDNGAESYRIPDAVIFGG